MFRLPSGGETTSANKYVKAWRALAKSVVEGMDVRLTAFDPDLQFTRPNGSTFDVPVDVALFIKNLYPRPATEVS